ncbi:MAG: hypothetical protein HN726_04275, partial [Candidatus Magasanikbacteria bacterium]|nr:hypothetical protein [Candidatus Magasanikbacteria bacterium]
MPPHEHNTHFSAELERLAALKKEKKIEDKAELERILEAAINKVDDYHDLVDAQKDELKEAVILIDGVKASFVNIKSSIDTAAIPVLDRAARQLANILIKLLRRVDKLQQQIDKERIFVVYAAMQKEQALIGADIGSLEDTNSLVLDYLVLSKRIEAKKNEELSVDEHVVAAQNFLPLLIHLRENIAVAVAALSSGTPDAAKSASDPSGGEKETAPTKYIYDKDLGNIREVAEGEEVKGTRVFVEATSPIHPSGTPVWVRSKPSGRGRIKPWMPAIFSKELQVEGTKDKKGRYFVFTNRSEDAPFLPPEHAQNTKPVSGWEVVTDEPEKKDIASSYERVIDPPIPSIILGVSESVYVVGERVYTFDNGHQTSAVRLSLNPDGSNPLNGKSLRGFADAAGFDKNKNIRIGSQNTRAYLDDQYVLGHVSRFEETPPEGFTPGDVVYVRVRDNQYSAVSVREVVKTSEGKSAIIIQSRPEDEEPGRKHLTHASDLRIPFVIGETAFSEKPKDGKWILLKREALDDSILVRSAEKGKGFEVGQAKHRDTTEFYASNNDTFIESSRISYVPDGVKKLSYAGESFVHLGAQLVDTGVYANGAEILVGDIVKVPNTGIIGDIVMGISGPKESEYDVKQIAQLEDGTFKIFVHAQYTPAKDADPIDVYTFIVVDDQVKTDKSAVSSIPVSLSPDDAAKKAAEAVAMSEAFEKFFTTFEEAKNVLEAKDLGVEFPELVNIDSIKLLPRTVVARYDIALSKVEEVAEAFRAVDADSSILVMHEPPTPLNDAFKGNNAIGYASGTLFINVSEPDWFSSLETHGNGKDLPFSLSSSVDTADTDEFDVIIPGSSDADKTDEFDVITNEQMAIRKIFHKFRALEAQNIGLAFRQFTTFEDGLDLGLTGMKKYETALPTLERFARAYAAVDSLSNIDVYHEGVKDKLHNVATAFVGNDTVSYDPVQHDVAINIDDPDWYLQFEGPLKVELPFDSSVSKVVEPLFPPPPSPLFPPPPSPLFPPLSSSSPEALPVNLEVSPDLPVGRPLDMSPNEIATIFGNDVLEKALQSFYDHNYDPKKIEESLLGLLANDTMLANIDMIIEERRNRKEGYHHTAEMVLKNLKEVMIPRIVHAVIQIESDKERELVFKDSRYQLQGNEGLSLKEKIARAWKDNKLAIIGGGIAALVGGAVAGPVAAGVTGGFIGKGLSRIERNDRYQTVLKDVRQNRMAAISATGMRDMAQYISYFTSTDYVASVKENTEDYGHDAVEFYYDQIQTLHREAYDATSRGESVDVINEQITTAKLRSLHAVLRERNAERLSIEDADKGPFSFLLPNQRLQDFGLGSHSAKKRAIGYAAELSVGAVVGSVVGIAGAASFLKVAGRFGIGAVTGSLEHYVQADAVGKRETEVLIAEYVQRLHTELSDYRDTALSSGSLDLSVYTTNIDRLHTAYERLTHIRAAGIISPDKEEFGLIESWIESLESIITSIGDKQLHTLLSNLDDLTYKESINTTSVLSTLHNEAWDKINSSSEGDVAHTLAKDDISRIRDAMENKKVSRMKKALWSGFKRGAFTAALGELFDGIRGRSFFAESIGLQGSSLPVSSGSDSGSLPPENVVSEKPSGFGSRATDIHGALTLGENGEPDLTVEADAQEKVAVVEPTPEADAQEKVAVVEPTPEADAQEKVAVVEPTPEAD